MYANMYSVCHIAGELLKGLAGGEHITKTDKLCVQIAALSHDLGECLIETITTNASYVSSIIQATVLSHMCMILWWKSAAIFSSQKGKRN